jgi:hypothetical protein
LKSALGDKSNITLSDVDEISTEIADEFGAIQLDGRTSQLPPNWSSETQASNRLLDNQHEVTRLERRLGIIEQKVNLIYTSLQSANAANQYPRRS